MEERKVVTVLFADVVASTQLSGTIDAEDLRAKMAQFFGIAREEIERFGGTVEKFIGDAVMAVFGLPLTHENDAERAVHAAVALRSAVRPYVEHGILPQIRIGLNTGEVVANPRAVEKGEFMITGEAVNLAARFQQHADPGQVLAGDATYAATRWAFEFRVLPPLPVKGKAEPVTVYECVGPRPQPLAPRGVPGMSSPLVGREEQFAAFAARFDRLLAGHGGIVSLIGEPGVGKSRLLVEVRRHVEDRVPVWLVGRALSFSQAISYWPFLEIIKSAAGITEADTEGDGLAKLERRVGALMPDQVAEVVPYLATLLGLDVKAEWRERVRYLDGEAMGRQIYRSSRLFVEHLAQDRPLVLVFEDLQWIDESSVGLFEHLLPLVRNVPLLLCGISRPDRESPAARLRETILRDYADRTTEITLVPLSPVHSVQLVQNLLQIDALPSQISEFILAKTEGNPFFVEEVIRALIDLGAVVRSPAGRWQISARVDQVAVPDTLRGVIIARIDRLEEEVKEVLKTAAVIGRHFFYRILRVVVEVERELDRDLTELQALELIRERRRLPELEYTFKHALTQEATYETILLRRRRELHRRVGENIEELFADRLEEFFGVLAYHYARAEHWEKAQHYLFRAGDQAGRLAADTEALAHYRQATAAYARAFGDRWDPLQRAVLERKMGEALSRRGEHQQAMEYLQRALVYLRSPFPSTRWSVRAAIGAQVLAQAGHRLFGGLLPGRAAGGSHPEVEERSRIYEAMGWVDYFVDVERVFLEALLLLNGSERHRFAFGIARGSTGLGLICDLLGMFRLAGSYHTRAVALAEEIQHPLAVGLAYIGLAFHQMHAHGRTQQAEEHFQTAATAYRGAGELRQWGAAAIMVAWTSRLRGDLPTGFAMSREVLRVGQGAGDPEVWGWGLGFMGALLVQSGALDEAEAHLRQALEMFKAIPDYLWVVNTGTMLGMCHLRQGKLQEAMAALEDTHQFSIAHRVTGFESSPPLNPLAEAYLLAAEQAQGSERAGWLARAGRACRRALRQRRYDLQTVPGALRCKGTYEWLTGRPGVAGRSWQRSLTAAETLGARFELGATFLEMGRHTGTRAYLERAGQIFDETGARWDLAHVRGLLKRAG